MMSVKTDIIKLRDAYIEAGEIDCTCSDIAIQYNQGCECKRGKSSDKAWNELIQYIKDLGNGKN